MLLGSSDGRVGGREWVDVPAQQKKGTFGRPVCQQGYATDCHLAGSKSAFPPLEPPLPFDAMQCNKINNRAKIKGQTRIMCQWERMTGFTVNPCYSYHV